MPRVRRKSGNTPDVDDVLRCLLRSHATHANGRKLAASVVARRLGANVTTAMVTTIQAANPTLIEDAGSGSIRLTDAGLDGIRSHPAPRSWSPDR